eukprot:g46442.t1
MPLFEDVINAGLVPHSGRVSVSMADSTQPEELPSLKEPAWVQGLACLNCGKPFDDRAARDLHMKTCPVC